MAKFVRIKGYSLGLFGSKVKYEYYDTDSVNCKFSSSVVDYSQHIPQGEVTKALKSGKIQGNLAQMFYDFPDGRDNGFRPPLSRNKGVDIAEVTAEQRSLTNEFRRAASDYVSGLKEGPNLPPPAVPDVGPAAASDRPSE